MTLVEGKPLSPGFARGNAVVYDCEVERKLAIPRRDILRSDVQTECDRIHPAVLRLIKQIVDAAEEWNWPLCVCGEEGGDSGFACLLVGLGIRELSLSPESAAAVRQAIHAIDSQLAAEIATQALRCRSPSEVREQLLRSSPESSSSRLAGDLSGN